jgi:hypothetical protein
MHEIDKMGYIKNREIQSHTIHKITQIFSLGNTYRRKPNKKVMHLCSLFAGMEIMQVQRRRHSLWIYLRPVVTPSIMLSNFPLPILLLYYGTQYNNTGGIQTSTPF